jgi:xylulokinase
MTEEVLLGIDAGTSALKVCAFTRDGRVVAKAQRMVPVVTPYPLWAEIDLERYWAITVEALGEIAGKVGPIAGIGMATTCPTTIVLDAQDRPLRPGMVYLDGRADAILRERIGDDPTAYQARTGNRASPSTCWIANLAWLRRHEPKLWLRVRRVLMLNGYLGLRLTGVAAMEATQASYSGVMDVREAQACWSEELLQWWDIDPALMPPLVGCHDRLGTVTADAAAATHLRTGIPVALGAADTATAAFAVGALESGSAFESLGTSGVISSCLERPDFDPVFLNRHHVVAGRWLAHGAMSTVGGAFGWLQGKVWPEVSSMAELERMAQESVPGSNGLVFLPYLAGERSPIWDSEASAAWIGLRLAHSRADMVRAVFEGGALGLRQILERAEHQWGWRPSELVGVGGGARSRFWAQIKADVLGLRYRTSPMTDASALGAAMLGGLAAGVYAGADDAALPVIRGDALPIDPGPAERRAVYDRRYRVFEALYPALCDSMRALAEPDPVPLATAAARTRRLAA